MEKIENMQKEARSLADKEKARILSRFFKTGSGEYGEGDLFLGITVPISRKIARKHRGIGIASLLSALRSPYHEERLIALLILVEKFERGTAAERKEAYAAYLANTARVNNWDLVDLTAPKIVGAFLLDKKNALGILKKLARSENLWERRIAIVSTLAFIRQRRLDETFAVADILLRDEHDLIHKAVGWMLREAGKRDFKAEESFLLPRLERMPRTALRYAIERFPEWKRLEFLRGITAPQKTKH